MPQDSVMPSPYVWFCRDCKTKGEMFGKSLDDNMNALMEHNMISPNCNGLVCLGTQEEALGDPEISSFKNCND